MTAMNQETDAACQAFARAMALRLLGILKLPAVDPSANCNGWAEGADVFDAVYAEVSKLDPASLGMLAASGGGRNYDIEGEVTSDGYRGTDNYDVHCGTYVNKYTSGWTMLRRVAATSLVARMYDIRAQEQGENRTVRRVA